MNKRTILVVDDDKNLLHGLAVHLEANDYDVLLATNINTAVNAASRRKVDFIVLDLELPDGEGYEVIDRLRIKQPEKCYRVLVLSARKKSTFSARPLDADVCGFFRKPVDIYEVLSAIHKVVPAGATSAV